MIVDTAGRLQIDERLMEELREVRAADLGSLHAAFELRTLCTPSFVWVEGC